MTSRRTAKTFQIRRVSPTSRISSPWMAAAYRSVLPRREGSILQPEIHEIDDSLADSSTHVGGVYGRRARKRHQIVQQRRLQRALLGAPPADVDLRPRNPGLSRRE